MKKLPQVTLLFWIMKIAATTLGETAGDLLSMTLNVGYAFSSMILMGLFWVTLAAQLRSKKYHPLLYWTVILSTSTAGTTMSDYMDRTLGLGYAKGTLILMAVLAAVFVHWRTSAHSFSVQNITTFKVEMLYCFTGLPFYFRILWAPLWVISWPMIPVLDLPEERF